VNLLRQMELSCRINHCHMTPSFSKLVLALALFLGLEHFFWLLWSGSWHLLAPSLVAYIHDLMLLVWIGAIFGGIRLMTVKKWWNFLPWVLGVFLSALWGFLALYPWLLTEFLSFPVNKWLEYFQKYGKWVYGI